MTEYTNTYTSNDPVLLFQILSNLISSAESDTVNTIVSKRLATGYPFFTLTVKFCATNPHPSKSPDEENLSRTDSYGATEFSPDQSRLHQKGSGISGEKT